jgi:Uma2 family endonuclease
VPARRTRTLEHRANGLAHQPDLDEREYPEGDGKPMGETPFHRDVMSGLIRMLKVLFADRSDVYVSGNMMLYYERGNRSASVSPDVFVTVGIPREPERRVYLLWREGLPPTWVLEVTSRSTRRQDLVRKRALYARLGVSEYFLFDPLGEYLHPPLQGFRLVSGRYEPIPASEADGSIASEALGVLLAVAGGQVRLFDRVTHEMLPTPEEIVRAAERRALEEHLRADAAERRAAALERQLAVERERAAELERRLREGRGPA